MMFDKESIEIATPEIIANYRAKRLACDTIIDIGCGIGGDTIALAKTCKNVIAIDINPRILGFAQHNCEIYGRKNIEFLKNDALKMNLKKLNVTYAFADPTRRTKERRIKELSQTIPPTTKLIEKLSSFKGFCIEASPQLNPEEIPFDCEREYLSMNGELMGLSLYLGELKKCEKSAVVLPSEAKLESKKDAPKPGVSQMKNYFYEIDPAVAKAGLTPELASNLNLQLAGSFLTSEKIIESPFFKNSFELLKIVDRGELIPALKSLDAKKVVLRGKIDPDEQPILKRTLDMQLSGTKKLHVFYGEKTIIAKCFGIKDN